MFSSKEALVNVLRGMQRFVNRLKVCTEIPLSSAIVGIMIRIMVGLISVLALETKTLHGND